jgi:Transglycosylase
VASSQYGPGDHEHGDGRDPPGHPQYGYQRGDRGYRDQYGQTDRETTLPLPIVDDPGDPDDPEYRRGPRASVASGGPHWSARPRRRGHRFLYKAAMTIATLVACLLIGFGVLLVVTPSAGQATAIAARIAAEHHEAYPGPAVPANFARPLVATEDHRFYSEIGGIDPLALVHVAASAVTGGPDQGGATIEVQLAKLLYLGADSPAHDTLKGKLTEVALAVKLNAMYGKAQVLRMYAEVAYYGNGYYGLQQASCGYFGHPAADLTVTQGAMLAGVVNAPAYDDPVTHPAQAQARLAHVIERMVTVGDLTPGQGRAALIAPLYLTPGHSPDC